MRRTTLLGLAVATALSTPAHGQSDGAQNVILMIADGVGFNGWLAADYYEGRAGKQSYQVERPDGTAPVFLGMSHWSVNPVDDNGRLLTGDAAVDPDNIAGVVEQGYNPETRWSRFEATFRNDFPPVAASYTSYTDSAAAGTTLQTGVKTVNGRLNMDWSGQEPLRTLAQIADEQGRATGAVSSVMASHATPASVWAHNVSRDNYAAIFNEMAASGLDVIMGGGHPAFDSSGKRVPEGEREYEYVGGAETWTELTSGGGLNGFTLVDKVDGFDALAGGDSVPDKVMGIARTNTTLQAERENMPADDSTPSGDAFVDNVPDLATMTQGALHVLAREEDGFFLMAEGGAPDWMAHANHMPRFIEEQMDFNRAVDTVIDWVEEHSSWDETLLIVTSDHETGGIWGAGTFRNGAGGPVASSRDEDAIKAARFDPREDRFHEFRAVQNRGAGNLPGYQFASGNHTNELVPLWALGPGSGALAKHTRLDTGARALWGRGTPYDWDGQYVANTAVFHAMHGALLTDYRNRATDD